MNLFKRHEKHNADNGEAQALYTKLSYFGIILWWA